MAQFGKYTVEITNPDRVLFPQDGITKGDLIEYYEAMAPVLLPHLKERPLALQRYPSGIGGAAFFQKNVPPYFPDLVHRVRVAKKGGSQELVVCDNLATLVYLANHAAITLHAWLSRADDVRRPDQMMFDFDPPGDEMQQAVFAARALKEVLDGLELPCFVKTSGGRGLHVLVPLARDGGFTESYAFAEDVARLLVARHEDRLTVKFHKAERGDRLFVDVLRNAYAQLVVAPYTVRARPGAPVSMPLAWSDLDDADLQSAAFTIRTAPDRVARGGDVWQDVRRHAVSLSKARPRLNKLLIESRLAESPQGSTAAKE